MKLDNLQKIFKAYDIRGIYSKDINEEIAYKIGCAIAKFLKTKTIVIGRDARNSSENLFKAISEGIRDQGIDIIDIGLATSPMLYFAVIKFNLKGGLMITASHNPPEYNGFKVVKKGAIPIGEESGLKKIKKLIEKDNFKIRKRGVMAKKGILGDYIKNILDLADVRRTRPLKIVVDTSNGTAGIVFSQLAKEMGVNMIHINSKLDGNFPNHGPNPLISENIKMLQDKIISEKADLGIAFDGDGDRIVFVDEKGDRIEPDLISAFLIKNIFKSNQRIIYTVISSRIIKEEIEKINSIPIESKVGYTFIKEKMKKENIVFGSEPSGHYYLKDNYFIESPFFVLLKILEILSSTNKSFSESIKPFKKYHTERENITTDDFSRVGYYLNAVAEKYKKIGKISRIDGVKVEFDDWWFCVRPSNTEPIIRLTIEAKNKILLKEKKKEIIELILSQN